MREKILITVKTYPTLSMKYLELVCTAGVNESGQWRRIYPVPFRQLNSDEKYKKYQWIEVGLKKSTSDNRPETYQIAGKLELLGDPLRTSNSWRLRREAFIDKVKIYEDLQELIHAAHGNKLSLAVFRPNKWLDFVEESVERDWDVKKLDALEAERQQGSLFANLEPVKRGFTVVKKLPYKFSYQFEDVVGKRSKLMIEDWEIGALYWNCLGGSKNNEIKAVEKVRQKYWDEFAQNEEQDTLLVLGTTREYHNKKAPNPFVIVGVIPIPRETQQRLF